MNEPDIIQNTDKQHQEFLNALLKGNHSICRTLVQSYKDNNISIQELYENIIKNAMYDVGELWEYNQVSVATEHLASAIVESILNDLYEEIAIKEKGTRKVITTCVENEHHQIGIKMVSDIFEMYGWNSHFLGSNTPNTELIRFIQMIQPDLLAVSLSLYFNFPKMQELMELLRKKFPELPILIGGQAFHHGGIEILNQYDNVIYNKDIYETESFIKNFK
jgi:methanogenic corrinoid protein MtbC1